MTVQIGDKIAAHRVHLDGVCEGLPQEDIDAIRSVTEFTVTDRLGSVMLELEAREGSSCGRWIYVYESEIEKLEAK